MATTTTTKTTEVLTLTPKMDSDQSLVVPARRSRALSQISHREYLDSLIRPPTAELQRISDIQVKKEQEIDLKYRKHTIEEHDAAKLIQRTYRGHRERRQLDGLSLDPSSRWEEAFKEWRYRSATAPHFSPAPDVLSPGLGHNPSDRAMMNWRRAKEIAERAGAGESTTSLPSVSPKESLSLKSSMKMNQLRSEPESMLLDLRYFLEMVDQKHRYGANLQVYHEEWQRSKTKQNFFYWLDRGEGQEVDLSMCPREKLEKERIRYLSREERKAYLVRVDSDGLLRWAKNDELITTSIDQYQDSMDGIVPKGSDVPTFGDEEVQRRMYADASFSSKLATVGGMFKDALKAQDSDLSSSSISSASSSSSGSAVQVEQAQHVRLSEGTPGLDTIAKPVEISAERVQKKKQRFHASPATILNHLLRASVRPGTWIYVADTIGRLYVGIKSSGAFQHASFLSGTRISSAGTIGIENGNLTYLSPLSGHYRPTTKSFRRFIESLKQRGVDTKHLKVSKAYSVLLGMEMYGSSKKSVNKILHPAEEHWKKMGRQEVVRKNELLHPLTLPTGEITSAADTIETNWKARADQKKGLAKLIHLDRIRRKSAL